MEFLRFGSSIPGGYWGCCAVCIIQNFKFDPNSKASIELVSGDGGGSTGKFAGPTYHDIFKTRIRIGTFSTNDMPNHAFFAVLTDQQINGTYGKAWLKILKEEGFEFLRTQDNSVYTGAQLDGSTSSHPNYIFALFRNITNSKIIDPMTPPKAWTDLPSVTPESWELVSPSDRLSFAASSSAAQKAHWQKGKTKLLTESDVTKAGAIVVLAGQRLPGAAPMTREARAEINKAKADKTKPSAFPTKQATATATAA